MSVFEQKAFSLSVRIREISPLAFVNEKCKLSQIKSKLWFVVILKSENPKHFWIFFVSQIKIQHGIFEFLLLRNDLYYITKKYFNCSKAKWDKKTKIHSKICVQQPNLFYFENPNNSNGLLLKFSIQYVSNKQISWALRHKNNKESFSQILLLLFHGSASFFSFRQGLTKICFHFTRSIINQKLYIKTPKYWSS